MPLAWSGHVSWAGSVAWEKLCNPKKEGGLGVLNVANWNVAAMFKHIWAVANKKDNLWEKWVHCVYIKQHNWCEYKAPQSSSWCWKKMVAIKDIVKQKTQPKEFSKKETIDHLFFRCDFSQQCLLKLKEWLKWHTQAVTLNTTLKWIRKANQSKFRKSVKAAGVTALVYLIWKARNDMIWNEKRQQGTFETIHVKDALAHEFSTRLGNVFTIGKGTKLWISLPKGKEVLSLDEGVGPVLSFNKVAIEEGKKRMDLCLVGKVIGPRPAYKEGIEKAMKGVWKINHRFQALDCPLRDFAGDNPNFDSGRFSSWMCAPGSPPRDRYRFNKKRDESPNNRPIMTMGEASRIDSAVERNRARYSGDDCIGGDKVMMETVTGSEAAVVDVVPEKKKGKEVAVDIGLTDSPGAICHLCWNAQGLGNPDALTALRAVVPGHIDALVKCPGQDFWWFSGFYGSPKASGRSDSWRLLGRLNDLFDLPWICDGDFNEILSMNEKKGGANRSMSAMNDFQQALDKCSLVDLGFEGQCFTWLKKRQVKVINGDFLHSDHRPIVATLENIIRLRLNDKKRSFQFETHWLKDDEFQEIVLRTWLSRDLPLVNQDSLIDIFGKCADQLGAWNKSKFSSIPRLVRETQKQLDDLLSVSAPLVTMDEVKRLELNDLLSREECYWKLRSRANWLALGDRNTKYFHKKATGRKKKNAIVEIMTEDGDKLSTEEDIVGEIELYFGTIFSSASPNLQQVEHGISSIEARISPAESDMLVAPFTAHDVWGAVNSIRATKALGPDGFHAMFFHKYWAIIGPRITAVCHAILNGDQLVRKFNKSNVVMILKVTKPTIVKEYRAISLCSVMYKIVAKAAALRLKGTLSPLSSLFQSAFVMGRAIHDNVMVGFELLHSLFKKNNGVRGFMALKLDMSKAYDKVEWCFLRQIMCKFRFPRRWVDLIMDCVTTPEYAFLAVLSLLRQSELNGELMGFQCSWSKPLVSHLFFADDSLIFGRANGLGSVATHDKYLGLPTVIGKNKKRTFTSICDKVQKRVRGWKRIFFSAGGREILIKAILCGEDTETPEHALVFCSSLLPIWSKLRVWSQLNWCRNGSLAELVVCLFEVLEQSKFELLSMIWWWVWYDRNSVFFGKKQSGQDLIFELAKDALEEFQEATVLSNGGVLGGPCDGFSGVVVVELLALHTSLIWAARLGYNLVRVETDSSVVSSWINCPTAIIMFKPIIEEIHSILAAVGGGSCRAILRVANGVAHALAKSVNRSVGVQLWTDGCPRFISAPVTADFI
uniref:Reverse transcriptase n=1 Tax=Cannabis sativa TaxID=3483 RepID=A0A803P9I4_CANSA